jgi:hypothetical protein
VAVSFIGGGNQSTQRKPPTSHWQTLSHHLYQVHFAMNGENWLPRYNWNIVESGVKHHKPNQTAKDCFKKD